MTSTLSILTSDNSFSPSIRRVFLLHEELLLLPSFRPYNLLYCMGLLSALWQLCVYVFVCLAVCLCVSMCGCVCLCMRVMCDVNTKNTTTREFVESK